jgi:osmotically-inducible protein OsmY
MQLTPHYSEETLMSNHSRESATLPRVKRLLGMGLLYGTFAMALYGCLPVTVVGSGVGGTMAATDRRTFGTQTEDKVIGFKGESVADAIVGNQGHVTVTSFNLMALITGEVPSESMKTRVASEVAQIPHVRNVINELQIAPPSSMSSRSNDSMLTARVSAALLQTDGLSSQAFKTITERGTVYLMGRVTEREGNQAAEVARMIPGVQRVVKVFEHITEAELERLKVIDASTVPADKEANSPATNPYKAKEEYK